MRSHQENKRVHRAHQEGGILLIVLLLVIMFTGFGLIAMRHTRAELRAAGYYLDNNQCAQVARTAAAMAATNLRLYMDETCNDNESHHHYMSTNIHNTGPFQMRFSPAFQWSNDCPVSAGNVPGPSGAVGSFQADGGLALTNVINTEPRARVTMEHEKPLRAPPPPGFTDRCEDGTYCFYDFTIVSRAQYGTLRSSTQKSQFTRSACVDKGQVRVGPIMKFD